MVLDLSNAESSVELAEAERLAEDLRLLYVALTRSIWHCSLGVAPLFRCRGEKTGIERSSLSALGRLIQHGEPKDARRPAPVYRITLRRACCLAYSVAARH